MQINVNYEQGDNLLPVGFKAAIQQAVDFLTSHINSNVTFNLNVGYGDVNGLPVTGLAGYHNQLNTVSYDNLVTALKNHATSADDQAAIASLPLTSPAPAGTTFQIAEVEAAALGLTTGTVPNISIGFAKNAPWDFTNDNIAPGSTDFVAQAINEITAAMGRAFSPAGQAQPLQLFDYFAPPANGQVSHQFNVNQDGYFSLDSGKDPTDPGHFSFGGFQKGDWNLNQGPDAFDSPLPLGQNQVSNTDLRVMDVLGFDLGNSTPVKPPVNPPDTGGTTPTGGAVGTELFGLMSSGTATNDQTAAWPKFAADQLAFYQKIGVADPSLGVWEAFGMAFSSQGKFAALNALSDADFAKTAWHDAFGADPTASQVDFVNKQVQSHANFFTTNHLYGADNPAVALSVAHGATFGIIVGMAEENGIHTHTV